MKLILLSLFACLSFQSFAQDQSQETEPERIERQSDFSRGCNEGGGNDFEGGGNDFEDISEVASTQLTILRAAIQDCNTDVMSAMMNQDAESELKLKDIMIISVVLNREQQECVREFLSSQVLQ